MRICIAGAGAFGTALGIVLARTSPVVLLGRDQARMAQMQSARENAHRLPGASFPASLTATSDPEVLNQAEVILLCVPAQKLRTYLETHRDALTRKHLVACCKGIDLHSLDGPADVIQNTLPQTQASILTGPSFAADIARARPTALTLAHKDATLGKMLQHLLSRDSLRLYRTLDVSGAQLGGALKNVIAIAAGAAIGAMLGESARAALITRGFAEMQRLAMGLGAQPETLSGLSGLGDLILTCSSEQSRNFTFGLALGQGVPFDTSKTVEGAATAQAAAKLAAQNGLDLPITKAVCDLVQGSSDVQTALNTLLSRPLKEE